MNVSLMAEFLSWYIDLVESLGYLGIFIMTLLESTLLPIPSEITMVPAGYLISTGEMNFWLVLLNAVLGTLGGALINYYIALFFGRQLVVKFGKYVFFPESKLQKVEEFFTNHGEISTFTGRLTPGIRHLISFIAGLSRMNIGKFCLFTTLGGSLWMLILIALGYFIGENRDLIKKYTTTVTIVTVIFAILTAILYSYLINRNNKKKKK
jgi:membrane protein DedA with SNARE-associated domain